MTTNIKDYSTTQASNTSLNGISVAEGMLPSNLNNAIRALMKNTRDWFNDAQWIEYGDGSGSYTAAYASATSFTIAGVDVTSVYHANRRIKLTATTPGTIFGTISSSNFSTNTTVNVTWDSGSLANETIDNVYIGALSNTNTSIPGGVIGTTQLADDSVTTAKILNGTIVNADINTSAAIDATKIHDGTISNTEFGFLNGVSSNIQSQLDAKGASNANLTAIGNLATTDGNFIVGSGSTWVAETGSTARASLGLGTISTQASNSVAITGGTITGLGAPSSGSDAANKTYVDDLVAGLKTRIITRAATTGNITLSSDLQNGDTLDGVTLATGNKVLVKDQTDATENGIYNVVASGTATRDTDYDTVAELAGQLVIVQEGSTNADKIFLCTTDNSGSIGSVNIVFTIVQPSNVGDVTLNGVQTLTNKTLTSPVISDIVSVSNGNISVLPNGTGKVLLDGDGSSGGVAVTDGLVEIKTGTGSVAKVKFYCESSNAHAQTLQAAPHSAASSAVLTLPTNTGTLIGTGDSGTLPLGAIDIDGGTDIGADLTTSDLIVVDDGAGGTNRKAALSRVVTFMSAQGFSTDDPTALAIALG